MTRGKVGTYVQPPVIGFYNRLDLIFLRKASYSAVVGPNGGNASHLGRSLFILHTGTTREERVPHIDIYTSSNYKRSEFSYLRRRQK